MNISNRARNINESATLAISAKAKRLIKEGKDLVLFGAGQPDFPTPENIKNAAINAIKNNFTTYTPVSGISELKEAIIQKFKIDNDINYEINEIIIGCGAKHILYNIMQILLNKGDEVILPVPYWVSYIEQVKLADATPILVETDNFKIKADLIEEKVNEKTKMIILNTPCNPSGSVIEGTELNKIADIAIENNIVIVSDEVYEHFIYDNKEHKSIASLNDEIKNLTLTVNAVSKTYSMTGWRIGYCGGPQEIIKAMGNLQSHSTSNPCSISQKAALEALTGPQDSIKIMVAAFDKRRKFMYKRLLEMGLDCVKPEGAFYCFPQIKKLTSIEFATRLLEEAGVAVIPGVAFGSDNHIRLSYATSLDNISKGLDRLERWLKKL